MIRSVYHDGTASTLSTPLVPNPGSTSVALWSAINDKTAATGAKTRPANSIIISTGYAALALLAKQLT